MKKAFTLIELVVAIAILVLVTSFAGAIFKVSIGSHRTGLANAEIMQRLRAITDQLDRDFSGLRKDGEIFVVWTRSYEPDLDRYVRFDRIMFFANGDFQSYDANPAVRGNIARISYMLASRPGVPVAQAPDQRPQDRILARTQHILTADSELPPALQDDPNKLPPVELDAWNNLAEYDRISLQEWKNMPWETDKMIALSVITGVKTDPVLVGNEFVIGAKVSPSDSNSIHNLLCQGVGEFEVQGWYEVGQRWVPEVDRDVNDFDLLLPTQVPGVLYHPRYGAVVLGGEFINNKFRELLNQERFDEIPGLGRALKFTFTLYDSRGIIREYGPETGVMRQGRTFTHIVYLGD